MVGVCKEEKFSLVFFNIYGTVHLAKQTRQRSHLTMRSQTCSNSTFVPRSGQCTHLNSNTLNNIYSNGLTNL